MIKKTDQEWQSILTPEEFRICRQQGTEPAFSGVYADCKTEGFTGVNVVAQLYLNQPVSTIPVVAGLVFGSR